MIIDETFADNPTTYTIDSLLKVWGLTAQQAAAVPAFADKKVRWRWAGLVACV